MLNVLLVLLSLGVILALGFFLHLAWFWISGQDDRTPEERAWEDGERQAIGAGPPSSRCEVFLPRK